MAQKQTKNGKQAAGRTSSGTKRKGTNGRRRKAKTDTRPWLLWTLALIAGVAVLRLSINALGWVPVHFDEGQYWAYGHELAWGHFSKPPLVGWIILVATEIGGDSTFALRIGSVICHALVAGLIFLIGRRLWDGMTGFWASAGYTLAPGVTVSAMLMSTDPVMMVGWAGALYAWVRAAEAKGRFWWIVLGAALGLGLLAKYTAIAFVAGAAGYGLFAPRSRDWTGVAIAAGVAFLVILPNLLWQVAHDFATFTHVAEDAVPDEAYNPMKFFEFFGSQFAVIGPLWFIALLGALVGFRHWREDWRMRLLGWQCFTLLLAMMALALTTRAHPNWAAPAYIAGSLLAARWLLDRDWSWALKAQAGIGALAALVLYGATWAYAAFPLDLPRSPDPFKKMRLSEPFCERALGAMAEEGADLLLSTDRRRLSECMFLGGIGFEEIAIWNPDLNPSNHHELVSTLRPGDERVMLLAVQNATAAKRIAQHFEDARRVEKGKFRTHSDREFGYALWVVQGFKGY